MKTAFIVNKTAGRNRTGRLWQQLEPRLRTQQPDFSVFLTPRKGAGTEIASRAQEQGYSRIIVVGGDGTLHETINGIHTGKAEIGIIPTGTGNDFCRSAGIPQDPFAAPDYIFSDSLRTFDLGKVNGHLFVNVAGVGFDAAVAYKVNTSPILRHFSGAVAYLLAIPASLLQFRNVPVTILVDDKVIEGKVFLAAVGNARYYGGGMEIVPHALPDDGLFHLCIARDINLLDALVTLPKMFSGKHIEHPKVSCVSGRSIALTAHQPLMVHADGEIVSSTPAKFEIFPGQLRVVCPPG